MTLASTPGRVTAGVRTDPPTRFSHWAFPFTHSANRPRKSNAGSIFLTVSTVFIFPAPSFCSLVPYYERSRLKGNLDFPEVFAHQSLSSRRLAAQSPLSLQPAPNDNIDGSSVPSLRGDRRALPITQSAPRENIHALPMHLFASDFLLFLIGRTWSGRVEGCKCLGC